MALVVVAWRHAAGSDVNGLAAELAYRSFLAFIPFFVVVTTIAGMIGAWAGLQNPAEQAFNLLGESVSPEVSGAIRTGLHQVFASRPGGFLGAAVLGTVLLGGSAGASVLKGIKRAYDLHERRPQWKRWLLGLGIALLAEAVLTLGLALLLQLRYSATWRHGRLKHRLLLADCIILALAAGDRGAAAPGLPGVSHCAMWQDSVALVDPRLGQLGRRSPQ